MRVDIRKRGKKTVMSCRQNNRRDERIYAERDISDLLPLFDKGKFKALVVELDQEGYENFKKQHVPRRYTSLRED